MNVCVYVAMCTWKSAYKFWMLVHTSKKNSSRATRRSFQHFSLHITWSKQCLRDETQRTRVQRQIKVLANAFCTVYVALLILFSAFFVVCVSFSVEWNIKRERLKRYRGIHKYMVMLSCWAHCVMVSSFVVYLNVQKKNNRERENMNKINNQ